HRDWLVQNAALEFINLECAAAEESLRGFVIGIETGPRVFAVELAGAGQDSYPFHNPSSRRMARISSINILRKSASGSPAGARPKCSSWNVGNSSTSLL